MKRGWARLGVLLGMIGALGCGKEPGATDERARKETAQKAASDATVKRFYWVQPLKGHPVHQLTQIAFREGCKALGYPCEVVGTDGYDIMGTIGLAEQALAREDIAGMAIWTGNPAYDSLIEKAARQGVPVMLPHFPPSGVRFSGVIGVVSADHAAYAGAAAEAMGKVIGGKGTVAVTQGAFTTNENLIANVFQQRMKEIFPAVKVLPSQEEGFEPSQGIAKAVAMLQANPDIVAAFSTTGGGATTWAGAQKETGRRIVAIGVDYTRMNLDLVQAGEVYAVIGQPLWEESYACAQLLDKAVRKQPVPAWTKLPAPIITRERLQPYYDLLTKVEAAIGK